MTGSKNNYFATRVQQETAEAQPTGTAQQWQVLCPRDASLPCRHLAAHPPYALHFSPSAYSRSWPPRWLSFYSRWLPSPHCSYTCRARRLPPGLPLALTGSCLLPSPPMRLPAYRSCACPHFSPTAIFHLPPLPVGHHCLVAAAGIAPPLLAPLPPPARCQLLHADAASLLPPLPLAHTPPTADHSLLLRSSAAIELALCDFQRGNFSGHRANEGRVCELRQFHHCFDTVKQPRQK